MFTVDCPRHRTRVLLGPRAIDALVDTGDGVDLHWTCRCGAHGVLHRGTETAAHALPRSA